MYPRTQLLLASIFLSGYLTAAVAASFSTFVYPTKEGNLTFSVNADASSGDVFFHLAAPASYQWVGVGTGSEMDGSVMWIVFPSSPLNGPFISFALRASS
jgi:hypothetical protein